MEATPRFELGVKALQASALPLGHVATNRIYNIRDTNKDVKIEYRKDMLHTK